MRNTLQRSGLVCAGIVAARAGTAARTIGQDSPQPLSQAGGCHPALLLQVAGSHPGLLLQVAGSHPALVNPVVQWNRVLLRLVRTPGAQPATVHSTRNFAVMHAAIYDAVNAIDRRHTPYAVRLSDVSRSASQEAAAAAAAHEVLINLYPDFQQMLDDELQQSLDAVPDGEEKT